MDERKLRHDYLNSIQILKNFVRMAAKGALDESSSDTLAIVEEAKSAIEFLEQGDFVDRLVQNNPRQK